MSTKGSKRITEDRVKKYAIITGSIGVPLAVVLFMLMSNLGVMTVGGSSGDMICGGDVLCETYLYDVCFSNDVFVYPMNGTWGLNASPSNSVEWIKLYRSWGSGWREIKLDQTCKGTWCGGKSNYDNAFVFAFREDKCYDLKFVARKNSYSTVHWSFNPEGDWLANKINKSKKIKENPLIKKELSCDIIEDTNYVGYNSYCLGTYYAGEIVSVYENLNGTEILVNRTVLDPYWNVTLVFNKTYTGLTNETPKKKKEMNVYQLAHKEKNGSINKSVKFKFKTKEEVTKLEKNWVVNKWFKNGCYSEFNHTWYNCFLNVSYSKLLYSNVIDMGKVYDLDILRIGNASTIINFTTSNVLVNNSVNDVFIYNLSNDNINYGVWYNGTNTAKINRGLDLTGTAEGEYVNISNADSNQWTLETTEDKTYSFWFNSDRVENGAMFSNWDVASGVSGLGLLITHSLNGDFEIVGGGATTFINTGATATYVANKWYHLALVKEGTNWKFYLDGTNRINGSRAVNMTKSPRKISIGENPVNIADHDGYLDDFAIYNRSLSNAEILSIYNRGVSYLPNNVSDGRFAYWNWDNNFIGSNERYNGTAFGTANITSYASWWQEANNTIVNGNVGLDGTNDYVSIANDLSSNVNNEISLEAWLYLNSYIGSSHQVGLITDVYTGDNNVFFSMYIDDNTAGTDNNITIGSFPNFWNTYHGPKPVLNTWYHYVGTYDKTRIILYQNGVIVLNESETGAFPSSSTGWRIGRRWDSDQTLNGKLDEVKVYNRTLSASEVNSSYQRGLLHLASNVSTVDLVGSWNFNIDSKDSSGNGNDGVLQSDALINYKSSKKEFPLKSYLVSSDGGLDIIDSDTNILWNRHTDFGFDQVYAKDGNIYVDNSTNFVNYSYINDVLPDSVGLARETDLYVRSNEYYWTNSTGWCRQNSALDWTFSCDNFTSVSDAQCVCANDNNVFVCIKETGLYRYNSGSLVNNLNYTAFNVLGGNSNNVTDCDSNNNYLVVGTR